MRIRLSDAGKRFNQDWIFRHIDIDIAPGTATAITGPNGSGKSTLLQVLGNLMGLTTGKIIYEKDGSVIDKDDVYRQIAFCAPYFELIEEMTLVEFLSFHQKFKPFYKGASVQDVIAVIGLEAAGSKQIRYFSSGMKQRVRLAQCILSDADLLLLDEPCSNLDAAGIELYQKMINDHGNGRTILVSSNDPQEYSFCKERVSILDYKR
jgi:ABC-type multidrug transport system ATPase subunit